MVAGSHNRAFGKPGVVHKFKKFGDCLPKNCLQIACRVQAISSRNPTKPHETESAECVGRQELMEPAEGLEPQPWDYKSRWLILEGLKIEE